VSNFFVVKLCAIGFLQSRNEARGAQKALWNMAYFIASSTATATATVIPTIGLLPVATAFIYRRLVSSTDISVELFFVIYRMVKHEERFIIIS
jgi:hypothetical protein